MSTISNTTLDLAVEILDLCIQRCDIHIPFYAYGDNQAACEMADQLNHMRYDLIDALDIIKSNAGAVPRRGSDVGTSPLLGCFVTAKLQGANECRQGFVWTENPLVIVGETGSVYQCEGSPVMVSNPPERDGINYQPNS